MLNKKNIILLLLALILGGIFLAVINRGRLASNNMINLKIGGKIIKTEVVQKESDLQKGLGGRENLCGNCGMLFVFSKPAIYPFWMKDMKFPLDIIWILDNKIVQMEKNVPILPLRTIVPKTEAKAVLETKAGKSAELDLKIGDVVSY